MGLDVGRFCGTFRGKPIERGGEWCRCFSPRKNAGPFGTILLREGDLKGHDGGPDARAAHFIGYFPRITTHCTGAAGPRGFSIVYSLTAAQ